MIINQNNCIGDQSTEGTMRPYEKCLTFGAEGLTDSELLAVILRTGTAGEDATKLAERIFELSNEKGLLGLLGITIPELMNLKGIGRVKAIQVKCICELSRRMAKKTAQKKLDFITPESIADYYMQDLRHLDKEHMILVMLDTKCRLIHDCVLSVGTVNASLVTPREVFAEALRFHAVSIVLLHNHPSGDADPSRNDIAVSKRIMQAGEILGIHLIDHIIIGDNTYTSLREKEFI